MKYSIRKIVLLLLFTMSSMGLKAQNDTIRKVANDCFVTIVTNEPCCIFVDNELKSNDGEWYGAIESGNHIIKVEKNGFIPVEKSISLQSGSNMVIKMDVPNEMIQAIGDTIINKKKEKPKPEYKKHRLITLNYSISAQPQSAIGLTLGCAKRFGGFVSVMTGFGFKGYSANLTSDDYGFLNGVYPFYTGNVNRTRLSVIVGGMFDVWGPFYAKLGVGYGLRKVAYETNDGSWICHSKYSYSGVDVSLGANVLIKSVVISLDAVTTSFKNCEIKLGVGLNIK